MRAKLDEVLDPHACTVLCAVANCRLGRVTSESVGGHAADDECPGGAEFHDLLRGRDLFVPSTFDEHHVGGRDATLRKAGREHRADFVALPLSVRSPEVRSWVDEDEDVVYSTRDHFPVLAKFTLQPAAVQLPACGPPACHTVACRHEGHCSHPGIQA